MSKWALSLLLLGLLVHVHGLGVGFRTGMRAYAPYQSTYTNPTTSQSHILLHAKKKTKRRNDNDEDERKHLQDDIAKRISLSNEPTKRGKQGDTLSKDKAISAPSTPKKKTKTATVQRNQEEKSSHKRTTMKRSTHANSSLKETKKEPKKKSSKKDTSGKKESVRNKEASFSSLLPPPLPSLKTKESESMSSGLSSWEEFLGRADSDRNRDESLLPKSKSKQKDNKEATLDLPSISDLFPPNVSSNKERKSQSLDGVLPVSELFYRSSQALSTEDDESQESKEGDDEELPFSAEQSDELETVDNKVRIRRNRVDEAKKPIKKNRRNRGRKLIRRGMEMFLGGTPINADPPQRSVELTYRVLEKGEEDKWPSAITLNTRDFGPLLYTATADAVSKVEVGLFCEFFVNAAMKWDVCPKDLQAIVKSHTLQQTGTSVEASVTSRSESVQQRESEINTDIGPMIVEVTESEKDDSDSEFKPSLLRKEDVMDSILSLLRNIHEGEDESFQTPALSKDKLTGGARKTGDAPKGFGKKPAKSRVGSKNVAEKRWRMAGFGLKFLIGVTKAELQSGDGGAGGKTLKGVLTRAIATVLRSKLDGLAVRINTLKLSEGDDGQTTVTFEFSLDGKGEASLEDAENRLARIDATLGQAVDDGDFALAMAAAAREETNWPDEIRDRIVEEILFEDDEAEATWEESGTEDVNGAEATKQASGSSESMNDSLEDAEQPFGTTDTLVYAEDDMFLGGGNGGVFYDYSESNIANSPFKGELGPALVDAVTARARERPPRVIAIGDVHGCIDELQDLLRLCDYRPGDLVVFLGDLVSKGPDSISVVQMAREIGAIAIRGNHDFEVIRWYQAIKSGTNDVNHGPSVPSAVSSTHELIIPSTGVDPPVVGSEHFHVASCLPQADMKWMYSLPWYMSSKELGALFVHAGFVSGIRLAKQNPRLMMNMRCGPYM